MKKEQVRKRLQKLEQSSLFVKDLVFEIGGDEVDEEDYHAPSKKKGVDFIINIGEWDED